MTITENKQRIKNEALNKIRKIYNPEVKKIYSHYYDVDGSYSEQREEWIEEIIERMEKELTELRTKKWEL